MNNKLGTIFERIMGLPEVRGLDLDSPEAVRVHRAVVQKKKLLWKMYAGYYAIFRKQADHLASLPGKILELGSGGGFTKEILPDVITSEVCPEPGVDKVIDAGHLPFEDRELKGILMLNVLHHLPDPAAFFREATRCLVSGGRIIMIEPFNSWLGRIVFKKAHHEPFDENAEVWTVQGGSGRLTASNQAMPWIIFYRDRAQFEKQYPDLHIRELQPCTVSVYLFSGGLSWRQMAPTFLYPVLDGLDRILSRFPSLFPLFQTIILEKR